MASDSEVRESTVGPAVLSVSALATMLVNLVLGWLTWLPATFAVAGVIELAHGEGSAGYTSDPDFVQPLAAASGIVILLLFVAVNAVLSFVLPGRRRWTWLVATVSYPIPWLLMQVAS